MVCLSTLDVCLCDGFYLASKLGPRGVIFCRTDEQIRGGDLADTVSRTTAFL